MKKLGIYTFLLSVIVFVGTIAVSNTQNNAGKFGVSGAPGENTCLQCHGGNPLNHSSGSVMISSSRGTKYLPGATDTLTITISRSGSPKYGFCLSAQANGQSVGTFSLLEPTRTQIGTQSGKTYISHRSNAGTSSTGSTTFTVAWTAPATNIGNLTFYVSANAVNGNGTSSGDFVFTSSLEVSPDIASSLDENPWITNLRIFPNPASDLVALEGNILSENPFSVTVRDWQGKIICQETFHKNLLQTALSTSGWSSGIYWIEIACGNKKIHKKLLIR
ncbi:MAG: T9SS type A sorting domain-containing protein [Bacteroidia bacterium]|nr:T9SS type A sorting domain-containing protein [Bacteroidia bacterium]